MYQRCRSHAAHFGRLLSGVFVLWLLVSCGTSVAISPGQAERSLPPDAMAYVSFRPERLRASIEALVNAFGVQADEIADILDRSDRIVAAIGGQDRPEAFSAVAEGSFPSGRVRFGLSLSRSWQRLEAESAGSFARYYQERGGLSQIAVPSSRVLLFSNGNVPDMLQRMAGFGTGPDLISLDPDAELVLRLPEITRELRDRLPREIRSLPFASAELLVHSRENDDAAYTVSGDVEFTTEQAAQVFNVIGRLVIATLAEGVGIRDISVIRTGRRIGFDGMRVTDVTLHGWMTGFAAALGAEEAGS